MEEIIGYVTLAEANEYVSNYFMSSDVTRVAWESLDDADKMVLLRNSYQAIESLTFRGRKTCETQPGAFPRHPLSVVPAQVKIAQIDNAIILANNETQEDVQYYDKLRTYGVESYSVGNLSETLNANSEGTTSSHVGIYSQKAMRLLNPWLRGGFNIS